MQQRQVQQGVRIWAQPNEYGYQFNINHPNVKRAYKEYQRRHGLDIHIPMTDAQRRAFEGELLLKLREHGLT